MKIHWTDPAVPDLQCLTYLKMASEEVLLIGDTTHDYEIACEIGCDCLSNGHQSYERLNKLNTNIISSLSDVSMYVKGNTV